MTEPGNSRTTGRRTVLRVAAAAGVLQLAPPFLRNARGEQPVLLGLCNPLTGTYAAPGKNELAGCELALSQINAGRHPGPSGRAEGRGFHQRRQRHRGAEDTQVDREGQGRLPAGQHQFGAGTGDGPGEQ